MNSKWKNQKQKVLLAFFYGVSFGFVGTFILFSYENQNELGKWMDNSLPSYHQELQKVPNLSELLFTETRVMCMIKLRSDEDLDKKLFYLMETWPKKCNMLNFYVISSKPAHELNLDKHDFEDLKIHVFNNQSVMLNFVKDSDEFQGADWFLMASEECYVIMENLRYMLYQFESDWPLFLAHETSLLAADLEDIHVFSKASLINIAENCTADEKVKDIESFIYTCMNRLQIKMLKTMDFQRKQTVFLDNLEKKSIFPVNESYFGMEYIQSCCSSKLVAIQGISGVELLRYHYFIYHARVFGYQKNKETQLPEKIMKHLNLNLS